MTEKSAPRILDKTFAQRWSPLSERGIVFTGAQMQTGHLPEGRAISYYMQSVDGNNATKGWSTYLNEPGESVSGFVRQDSMLVWADAPDTSHVTLKPFVHPTSEPQVIVILGPRTSKEPPSITLSTADKSNKGLLDKTVAYLVRSLGDDVPDTELHMDWPGSNENIAFYDGLLRNYDPTQEYLPRSA